MHSDLFKFTTEQFFYLCKDNKIEHPTSALELIDGNIRIIQTGQPFRFTVNDFCKIFNDPDFPSDGDLRLELLAGRIYHKQMYDDQVQDYLNMMIKKLWSRYGNMTVCIASNIICGLHDMPFPALIVYEKKPDNEYVDCKNIYGIVDVGNFDAFDELWSLKESYRVKLYQVNGVKTIWSYNASIQSTSVFQPLSIVENNVNPFC